MRRLVLVGSRSVTFILLHPEITLLTLCATSQDVYRGMYLKKPVAIADIRGHLSAMDLKELSLLRDLRHPNIVNFIGVSIPHAPSSVPVTIISEHCSNGDLFDYLRAAPAPGFQAMLEIMLGIARGLEYLHTRTPAIIHRDMKSSNVLITAQGVAKINDFGLARVKNTKKSVIRSLVGTVNWQGCELWTAKPRYSEKVDVYSAGLVFWEVLQWHQPVKRYPFEGMNEHVRCSLFPPLSATFFPTFSFSIRVVADFRAPELRPFTSR